MTRAKTYFTDRDPEDIDFLEATSISISGASTISNIASNVITVGFIGVGTTNPQYELDVNGDARISGILGIGTTNPQYELDVVGDINITGEILQDGGAYTAPFAVYAYNAGIATYSNLSGIATYSGRAGVATYAQVSGISTFTQSAGYASTSGISTYAGTAGISTLARGLTGTPNIVVGIVTVTTVGASEIGVFDLSSTTSFSQDLSATRGSIDILNTNRLFAGIATATSLTAIGATVGIITANAYLAVGSTAIDNTGITSTVNSSQITRHYLTFNTTTASLNISNFTSGKEFVLIARNTNASARSLTIRTSLTTTGHQVVPTIVHSAGTITTGVVSIPGLSGLRIDIFNVNGTVIGSY